MNAGRDQATSQRERQDEAQAVAQRFYDAVRQVMRGDAGPMLALWSARDDAACFDPRGGIHQGRAAITAYWERAAAANRATPGAIRVTPEHVALHASGTLLCAVSIERIEIVVEGVEDGATDRQTARATNVYRREDAGWRLIHRHSEPTRPAE